MSIVIPACVVGGLGLVFGLLLAYASKRFAVEVDEKVQQVRDLLPGANCSGCGFPSCDAFAAAACEGKCKPNQCVVNTAENRRAIGALLGMAVDDDAVKKVSTVLCQGDCEACPPRYQYDGIQSCRAVQMVSGGSKTCVQGCLGFGDCASVCVFDAIEIGDNGLPHVNAARCTGCGACVSACPRGVLALLPQDERAQVLCRTQLQAKDARKACKHACIRCRICEKNCPEQAISMQDGHMVVDPACCTHCGVCVEKCPTKAMARLLP